MIERKPNINIGTIGHVDHGKTTTTAAITFLFSPEGKGLTYAQIDKAPEEQKRGITINATTVEYETKNRHYSHTDCPGHEDFIKNMIAGASKMEMAILIVSCVDGVSLQTTEHVILASRCGIKNIAIIFTKADLLKHDEVELFSFIMEEVTDLLNNNGFKPQSTIPTTSELTEFYTSSETEQFVDLCYTLSSSETSTSLLEQKYEELVNMPKKAHRYLFTLCAPKIILEADKNSIRYKAQALLLERFFFEMEQMIPLPPRDLDKPFALVVESVFNIKGRGVVVSGTVIRGKAGIGTAVEIVGGDSTIDTTITGVEAFKKTLEFAQCGDDVGILLRGVNYDDISRGMVVSAKGQTITYSNIKCMLRLLTSTEGGRTNGIQKGYRPQFYIRCGDYTGVIEEFIKEGSEYEASGFMMMPGDTKEVLIKFEKPIPGLKDETDVQMIIREGGKTVGQARLSVIVS